MKLLLDQDVPEPLLSILEHLLYGHEIAHVHRIRWGGKTDRFVYADAAREGYEAILTNDISQLSDPDECTAIQRSGMHWISYEIINGVHGLALASAAICAAIRPAIDELSRVHVQQIVRIHSLDGGRKRYEMSNPATDPPSPYWPGAGSRRHRATSKRHRR